METGHCLDGSASMGTSMRETAMPYLFEDVPQRTFVPIISMKLGEPVWVIVGSDRSFDRTTKTHYLLSAERTVPCLHNECPWCKKIDVRVNSYLPAQFHLQAQRVWKLGIVFLTDGMQPFRAERRENTVWCFERKGRKNSSPRWWKAETLAVPLAFPGFDVTESVLRAWGQFKNYKRLVETDNATLRLFTDSELPPPSASAG